MFEILQTLKDTPLPSILVIGGLVFLLLPFIKKTGGAVEIETGNKGIAALIGMALLLSGIALYILPVTTSSSAQNNNRQQPEQSLRPTITPAVSATSADSVNLVTSEPSPTEQESSMSLPSPTPIALTPTSFPTPFVVCPNRMETGTGQTVQMQIMVPAGQVAYYGGWGFDGVYGGFFVTFNGPYEGTHLLHDGVYCPPVQSNTAQAEATKKQILNECAGRCPTLIQLP